jgi:putative ABC transport system substrate-binding protein
MVLAAGGLRASVAWPQPSTRIRRIGFLAARSRSTDSNPDPYVDAFVGGLRDLGYIEGSTIRIEWRFADADYSRLPRLAAELVQMKPELLATHGTAASQALQRATSDIPIVFMNVIDPLGSGLVASLARPGRNLTGTSSMSFEIGGKQVELLKSVIPNLSRIAVLLNPGTSSHAQVLKNVGAGATRFGVHLLPLKAARIEDVERAFVAMKDDQTQAFIVPADVFFLARRSQITELAVKHRLPSMFTSYEDASVGGALMSFGPHRTENYRRAAIYVDKIFKGARPAELPVEQPTKFEFVVNMRIARALDLTFPSEILIRADAVIR